MPLNLSEDRPVADLAALTSRAWELCYLDPLAARDIGHQLVENGGETAGQGWLHVALGEVRVGDSQLSKDALQRARKVFVQTGDCRGLVFCDEVHAIALRRDGHAAGAARLQAEIDSRSNLLR